MSNIGNEGGDIKAEPTLAGYAGRCDGKYRNNTSGYPGVSRHKKSGRWQALIGYGGKQYHLGLFDTPEAAHDVYVSACDDPSLIPITKRGRA